MKNTIELLGKYAEAKMFIKTVNEVTIGQVITMLNEPVTEGGIVRIMPDAHYGKGSTVGTTIHYDKAITKVVPSIVGVDIGCGIMVSSLGKLKNTDAREWGKLDNVINTGVPSGFDVRSKPISSSVFYAVEHMLKSINVKGAYEDQFVARIANSVGTLGGGNHFIELSKDEEDNYYLLVHTGSRGLGVKVAKYHQDIADLYHENDVKGLSELISELKAQGRHKEIQTAITGFKRQNVKPQLPYLEGEDLEKYLIDMELTQQYAVMNRNAIVDTILKGMGWTEIDRFDSIHNYIDIENNTIRKGATDARKGLRLVIPLNMKEGSIIGVGKGNKDWNESAPHGAGRVLSRSKAKEVLSLEDFKDTMQGIYTTSVVQSTLDEAPKAYKDAEEIKEIITDTVDIDRVVKPVYNFKAK